MPTHSDWRESTCSRLRNLLQPPIPLSGERTHHPASASTHTHSKKRKKNVLSYTSLKIDILQSHIHEYANAIETVYTGIKTDRAICKCLSRSFYLLLTAETRLKGLKKRKWKGEEKVYLTVKWAPLAVRVKRGCVFTSLIYLNIIVLGKGFFLNDSIWGFSRTMLSLSVLSDDFPGRNWMSSSPVELKMKLPVPIIIKPTRVQDTRGKKPK